MRTVHTVAELREALRGGASTGLVATMGALHEGHLSLVRASREECDQTVLSIFVNPTQFGPGEDFERYPRDHDRDARLAEGAGVDVLFVPHLEEVYPPGFATTVSVSGITEVLEGAHRGRSHFDGVATVVTKLLLMVRPQVAFFGAKDAQQLAVLRRVVADLNLPVTLRACPTVREPGGLAMSSRNAYLTPEDRERALALHRSLQAACAAALSGDRDAESIVGAARAVLAEHGIQAEYVALVDPDTFLPAEALDDTPALLCVAAQVGRARLIDNELLQPHPLPRPETETACSA